MHLVLNSYGTTLAKENQMFAVINHEGKQLIPPDQVQSISISKGAKITSDAVLLAIEHEIDVLFINALGFPEGRVWSHRYGSIATIRKNQIAFIYSSHAVKWVKQIIQEKMDNQIAMLLIMEARDDREERIIQHTIKAITDYKNKVIHLDGEWVTDIAPSLRGWEGAASKRYFDVFSLFLPEFYRFEQRTQHPATDPFNALLNYGYGMLYGKIEGALIKAGIDPYVGVFHRDDYNRPVLVYDVMEKYRVWVDYVAFQLAGQDVLPHEGFVEKQGAIWLDGLTKRIYIQAIQDYLSEIITIDHVERSRETHIQLYAQQLAKFFLQLE
ncbi:MAG: CRISPR-associated endonuclease Cas1 [Thermoflavifilum sp.]|uniref:CRISPR-associated endonuclease Cas1 n=1 Tax=Thermoflavifilum sp. TaxID=1968839 RepID=UPI0018A6685E|nr:CRISPR-associated endonuclease Cas1 [Thermoflavifilum sp.]QOR75559.1 MAG: CRISPR-associated endonuclease Cas1 [Thermoflavifilum sp.]